MATPDTAVALLRGIHLGAIMSLLGTAGVASWLLPDGAPLTVRRLLRALEMLSGITALLAGAGWFIRAASLIGGDHAIGSLEQIGEHTRFGTLLIVRLSLVSVATAISAAATGHVFGWIKNPSRGEGGSGRHSANRAIVLLSAAALSLQGWIGHAGAIGNAAGLAVVVAEACHVLAASIWLGALVPLWLSLRVLPQAAAAEMWQRFAPVGLACVLVLAGTGTVQSMALIGSIPALFGTRYGHIALVKLSLLLAALLLAALNPHWLTDRPATGSPARLLRSVVAETLLGFIVVGAAAVMASTVPAIQDTPIWPFPWQFSLVTVNEDPEFRTEVIHTLLILGSTMVLLAGSLFVRRLRLPAIVLLAVAAIWRGPSLDLLVIEANPFTFQTSPTDFSAESILRGQAIFAADCAACHGAGGYGDGPAAAALRIKPADLNQPHLWGHTDGEMFWWVSHGFDDPEGGQAMPGFAGALSDRDRWAVIDYVRAHNASEAIQQDVDFTVRAPGMALACANGVASLRDLQGAAVHIITDPSQFVSVPPQAGVPTVTVDLSGGTSPANDCISADPAAWSAFAVLAGVPADRLDGASFLVDPKGWLRAVHRPGAASGWDSPERLIAAIRGICTSPAGQPVGAEHEHQH